MDPFALGTIVATSIPLLLAALGWWMVKKTSLQHSESLSLLLLFVGSIVAVVLFTTNLSFAEGRIKLAAFSSMGMPMLLISLCIGIVSLIKIRDQICQITLGLSALLTMEWLVLSLLH